MAQKVPMKLRYLRLKSEKTSHPSIQKTGKSCEEELNNLITCWRLNGVDSTPCLAAVQSLSICSSILV